MPFPMMSFAPRHGDAGTLHLRNAGGKPLRVRAELLAEGSSRDGTAPWWHEIALYRTEDGEMAVALRLSRAGCGIGIHRARLFPSLDDAASWLEAFDPAIDLAADFDVSDATLSAAAVTVKAAGLRERAARLERGFRTLVGELLFQIMVDS